VDHPPEYSGTQREDVSSYITRYHSCTCGATKISEETCCVTYVNEKYASECIVRTLYYTILSIWLLYSFLQRYGSNFLSCFPVNLQV